MSTDDLAHALAALSARMSAIELAIGVLAPRDAAERKKVLQAFDAGATELIDQYLRLPVDEGCLELLRQSIEDMQAMLSAATSQQLRLVITRYAAPDTCDPALM